MANTLFISSNQIQIASVTKTSKGLAKISHFDSCTLSGQSVVNGVITNAGEVTQSLKQMVQRNPGMYNDVAVVMDSGSVMTKKIPVPSLTRQQYQKVIAQEVAQSIDDDTQFLFEYSFMQKQKSRENTNIFGVAVAKELPGTYLSVLSDAGVKVSQIYVGLELIINFAGQRQELSKGIVALSILDGANMLSVVFKDGEYMICTRSRLYNDNIEQYVSSILQNLSSLVQFNKEITHSYYIGGSENLVRIIQNETTLPNVTIASLPLSAGDEFVDNCVFPYMSAFAEKDSVDLAFAYAQSNKKQRKPFNKLLLIPIAFGAAALLFFAYFQLQISSDLKAIKGHEDYLNAETTVSELALVEQLKKDKAELDAKNLEMSDVAGFVVEYFGLSVEEYDRMNAAAEGTISLDTVRINADTKTISVGGTAADEFETAAYINRLRNTLPEFDINYTGYSKNNDNWFSFTLDITESENKSVSPN